MCGCFFACVSPLINIHSNSFAAYYYLCQIIYIMAGRGPLFKGGNVTFASWNVRGLNNQIKRTKVCSYLKSIAAGILFLQETHRRHSDQMRLRCSWISQEFQSSFSSRARGVDILVRKSVPFKHISTISDPNCRYVIVSEQCHIAECLWT